MIEGKKTAAAGVHISYHTWRQIVDAQLSRRDLTWLPGYRTVRVVHDKASVIKTSIKTIPALCQVSLASVPSSFPRGIFSGKSRQFITLRLTGDLLHVACFNKIPTARLQHSTGTTQSPQLCNQAIRFILVKYQTAYVCDIIGFSPGLFIPQLCQWLTCPYPVVSYRYDRTALSSLTRQLRVR